LRKFSVVWEGKVESWLLIIRNTLKFPSALEPWIRYLTAVGEQNGGFWSTWSRVQPLATWISVQNWAYIAFVLGHKNINI
jgi:hypothetical protein